MSDRITGSSTDGARLRARPTTPTATPPVGVAAIPITLGVDGLVYFPSTYEPSVSAPVALLLHGGGEEANELMAPLAEFAEPRGLVLAAVTSTQGTWDAIQGVFGQDVRAIDVALSYVFARCNVDTNRLGVIGFSDGGTYAIGLTRANGDLFKRVCVYSPGFLLSVTPVGKPEYFITHGTQDQVLSFENTKNFIVPTLRNDGYSVEFHQFDGGHGVTPELAEQSVEWFVR
jgi:phospholipase/carboxylesterase